MVYKYPNRRLYCTEQSRYVTLQDLVARLRKGDPVKVLERKSGNDITAAVLCNALADRIERGESRVDVAELSRLLCQGPVRAA